MTALEQHRRALEAEEDRSARLTDEVAALRIELDQAIEAEIRRNPGRSPFENVSSAPHRINKKLLAKQAELEGVDRLLAPRREILAGLERAERAKEAEARIAEAAKWQAEARTLWADAEQIYAQLVDAYTRIRALEDRIVPWFDGNEAAALRDPEFGRAWAQAKHAHQLENLYDASSYENAPLFPQSIPTFTKVLEWARREHAAPVAEPTRYCWVSEKTGEVDVSTDPYRWSHLEHEWTRLDFGKAVSEGIIDEDGTPLKPKAVAAA